MFKNEYSSLNDGGVTIMYVKLWPTELMLRNSLHQSLGIVGLACSVMTSALSLQCFVVADGGSWGGWGGGGFYWPEMAM